MKKMLIIALIALFYIAISAMVPPQTVPTDRDVGYSLTIDQNIPQTVFLAPAVADYQIVRGVSVPYRGLINQDLTLNLYDRNLPVCRIDNYRQYSQESISINSNNPVKGVNLFASDLGTWERYSKINAV